MESNEHVKIAELCAGYGGLSIGLELAGVDVDLVWYAETDPDATAVMAHHHPETPNLGDLTQITDPPPVDMVTAGFPCQPVSTAGQRNGITDERWIIDDVCRVAALSEASWLFLENVPGLLTANDGDAMGRVCEAMAHNGYRRWEWTTVRASDVGAPHQRNRWFCIAANTDSGRRRRIRNSELPENVDAQHWDDPDGCACERFGGYAEAVHRWKTIIGRRPPSALRNGRLVNPAVAEWMMGLPEGHVTNHVKQTQALKILGNGCVPQQAAAAFTQLEQRFNT